jgi:DNA-binding NtrC family response regulator
MERSTFLASAAKSTLSEYILRSDESSIFLDEIGDISYAVQVRLLRVLEDKAYEPLGSTKSVKTNARVVAATHQNLKQLVEQGRFREDLYYRINISTNMTLKEIEKTAIQQALIRNDWKKMATTRELGIDKNTLRRKIIRLGIINKS